MPWAESNEKTGGDIEREHRLWALEQPETGLCAFCPEYRAVGTAREVREMNEAHRLANHPERKWRRKRNTRSVGHLLVLRQSLTDDDVAEIDAERIRRMKLLGIE